MHVQDIDHPVHLTILVFDRLQYIQRSINVKLPLPVGEVEP